MFDPHLIKRDFPIFQRRIHGKPLIYLDNASTTQKPQVVLNALTRYYTTMNANIHRGIHTLSEEATAAYEGTRETVAKFIGARATSEIVFTRNATEAINLVAYTWARANIQKGDAILVTELEHHSNLVPWQRLIKEKEATLHVLPIDAEGCLDLKTLPAFLTAKTKLVCVTQMSNVLGTIVPVKEIIAVAHANGSRVLVDGAQSVSHFPVNVSDLDCDFLAFSSHKMLGPTGVGVLYGKQQLLEEMEPFLSGGDMVLEVDRYNARWNRVPWKFEAGTSNIADVVAFKEAIDYIERIGRETIAAHDQKLLTYARKRLREMPGLTLYGPSDPKKAGGILSFNVDGVHAHDVAEIFNQEGVAIRSGHHCANPLMQRLGVPATARMSFSVYNTEDDIDLASASLRRVHEIFMKNAKRSTPVSLS